MPAQIWIAVSIPTVAILASILQNQFNQTHLTARLLSIENRLNVIEGDLRRFWQILGEHSAKIENLEK